MSAAEKYSVLILHFAINLANFMIITLQLMLMVILNCDRPIIENLIL
jgi:hypothetical protein